MTSIRRIGSTDLTTSPQPRDARSIEPASSVEVIAPRAPSHTQSRANAGLRIEQPQYRAAANFLTQYIDQHVRWPRAPHRKDRLRQRATSAYINADMLPDVLADALRLHPIDKKI